MAYNNKIEASKGCPLLYGVSAMNGGYNFTVSAPEEAAVFLLLYHKKEKLPSVRIELKDEYREGRVRSVLVRGIRPREYEYNYEIGGRVCLDPYTRLLIGRERFGEPWPEEEHLVRCALPGGKAYSWDGDSYPEVPYEDMVLYKLHVRGFTKQAGSRVKRKGTFQGIVEMIPYFQELGVNALELMPSYEFSEYPEKTREKGMVNRLDGGSKVNYWGYVSGYYFAPKSAYCAGRDPENEFRDMVKALHRAGILCIMDFYFPKGTEGNTALHALQFWRLYYHVDGFHVQGDGVPEDLLLRDALLSETKMMVSGCDYGSIYMGKNPAKRVIAEYNPGFQETIRRFMKSDEGMVGSAVSAVKRNGNDHAVINYIASQDGFTLYDMVSYNYRHNEENGENNEDGSSFNYSWNCGVEGETRKIAVRNLREQQMRNAVMFLALSQGVPMIYAGDEFGNSQNGNNNAWCQDNPTGWTDWKKEKKNRDFLEFVKRALLFRKQHPVLHLAAELKGTDYLAKGFPDVSFHGERAWYVDYDNTSRMFGVMYHGAYGRNKEKGKDCQTEDLIYVGYNFHWEKREFALPSLPDGMVWEYTADTSKAGGWDQPEICSGRTAWAGPRSIIVLTGREAEK